MDETVRYLGVKEDQLRELLTQIRLTPGPDTKKDDLWEYIKRIHIKAGPIIESVDLFDKEEKP